MERMMEAMIANQEQLIAANKALEKQVKDLNEVVASCKQAHASKKVTEKVIVPNVIKVCYLFALRIYLHNQYFKIERTVLKFC